MREQCLENDVAFFLKQIGFNVTNNGIEFPVHDDHGGEWTHWPEELRVRELPTTIARDVPIPSPSSNTKSQSTAKSEVFLARSRAAKKAWETRRKKTSQLEQLIENVNNPLTTFK